VGNILVHDVTQAPTWNHVILDRLHQGSPNNRALLNLGTLASLNPYLRVEEDARCAMHDAQKEQEPAIVVPAG
jgi:hypothetical protein